MVLLSIQQQSPVSQEESPRGTGEVQQHYQYPVYRHPQEGKNPHQLLGHGKNMKLNHLHTYTCQPVCDLVFIAVSD